MLSQHNAGRPLSDYRALGAAWLIALAWAGVAQAGETLLPGLSFYPGPEKLTGRLVFLADRRLVRSAAVNGEPSVICEYSLEQSRLTPVAGSPCGLFAVAEDGTVYCVVFGEEPGRPGQGVPAFLFDTAGRVGRVVNLGAPPRAVILLAGQAFFRLPDGSRSRLAWFDARTGAERLVSLPGVSAGEDQGRVETMFAVPGASNVLRFEYRSTAKNIRSGCYDLDMASGRTTWYSTSPGRPAGFRASDGGYVWFNGPNGPLFGTELVWSSSDRGEALIVDPQRATIRVLHRFPRPARGADYALQGLPPCKRFALVCHFKGVLGKAGNASQVRTYYLVNLETAKRRLFVKDRCAKQPGHGISDIYWIRGAEP